MLGIRAHRGHVLTGREPLRFENGLSGGGHDDIRGSISGLACRGGFHRDLQAQREIGVHLRGSDAIARPLDRTNDRPSGSWGQLDTMAQSLRGAYPNESSAVFETRRIGMSGGTQENKMGCRAERPAQIYQPSTRSSLWASAQGGEPIQAQRTPRVILAPYSGTATLGSRSR
jgi:hypothetical protein